MTIKDAIACKLIIDRLSDIRDNLFGTDTDGLYIDEEEAKKSEELLKSMGILSRRYALAALKGAEINPDEEIGSETDLVSDLIIKVLSEK